MNVYTKENDTKLQYYCSDKNAKKYSLPAGFKAYITVDSGSISNISLIPEYVNNEHELIRYQIIGADDSIALVYMNHEPKLELHNSIAECSDLVDWYNSKVDISKRYDNIRIQLIRFCKITASYEYEDFSNIKDALKEFGEDCTLVVKACEGKTLLNMYSSGYRGVDTLTLTTCLHTNNMLIKPIIEYFNEKYS